MRRDLTPPQPPGPRTERVALPGGPTLAVHRWERAPRPHADDTPEPAAFLLVHGLASNARMWDAVAGRLAGVGHDVAAVDLRGHGRSPDTPGGHDTATAAADLAALIPALGLHTPVVAGQSWGGNVALELAARHGGVRGLALVDGGWIRLADHYRDFAACWAALAPPSLDREPPSEVEARLRAAARGWPAESVEALLANLVRQPDGSLRNRLPRPAHREILQALFDADPAPCYPRVTVPTALLVAAGGRSVDRTRGPTVPALPTAVEEARDGLADAVVVAYPGAPHDLHAALPDRVAADLRALAARTEHQGEPAHRSTVGRGALQAAPLHTGGRQ